jgi:predicted histone-like DNA-binding protein
VLAKEVAEYSSLTSGDVKNTIDNLITVMTKHLQASESVTLDGLGSFRMVMRSGGNGVETEEEVSAAQASLTILFTPSYTRTPKGAVATRSMVTGARCMRYRPAAGVGGNDSELPTPDDGSDDGGVTPDPNL